MISLLSILDVDENFKNLWKIVAFVLIVELENLWHSNVVVLAHGHLNEQVLCKTGKTHFMTNHHPWGRDRGEAKGEWRSGKEWRGVYLLQ